MNEKERRHLRVVFGQRYRRHLTVSQAECFYCGAIRECLDHVPPLAAAEHYARTKNLGWFLIPSCFECNALLGDRDLPRVWDRMEYLLSRYEAKYERYSSLWTKEELGEIKGFLKQRCMKVAAKEQVYAFKIRRIQERLLNDETWPQVEDGPDDAPDE